MKNVYYNEIAEIIAFLDLNYSIGNIIHISQLTGTSEKLVQMRKAYTEHGINFPSTYGSLEMKKALDNFIILY